MFHAHRLPKIDPVPALIRAAMVVCALCAFAVAQAQQPQSPPAPAQQPDSTTTQTNSPSPANSAPSPDAAQTPAAVQAPTTTASPAAVAPTSPAAAPSPQPGAITEEELKQTMVGKQFYLRGGYQGDSLTFDEHGRIFGHSPQGSYTLSVIQIDHVRLTKHKVELEGARYGLHFNEQAAYEDSSSAFDKVRITPKKKVVKITIDREMVVNPKKKKEPGKERARAVKPGPGPGSATGPAPAAAPAAPVATVAPTASSESDAAAPPPASPSPGTSSAQNAAPASAAPESAAPAQPASAPPAAAAQAAPEDSSELSEADQLKASIAATPAAERPADPSSVTTTTSQAHANKILRDAIDATLAPGLDDRMMAAMPDFWKLYYKSVAAKADYRPADPTVLRQNTVDQKAHLLTAFEPDSNEFAQTAGVAGMALYHTVIDADGKPGEIAVARPIGFGLDENAVASIRKAKFSPAVKNGQPVPVMLDLIVQFRIFSKRTAAHGAPDPVDADKDAGKDADKEQNKPPAPVLPGPYSVPHPN
jgi:hypothetical protein